MTRSVIKNIALALTLLCNCVAYSQIVDREEPKEWEHLVDGAKFIDRFLPMEGDVLSDDTWGFEGVVPRYVDNGIEDNIWSYWGGNIKKGDDGLYHMFVCGWLEASDKGHMEWRHSYVFNTVCDNPVGPFKLKDMIGRGHNPEAFVAKNGQYVIYVINGRYVADDINGPFEYGKFDFDSRDRRVIEGLSNLSFTQREDSSYLMVCRGGGIWISKDGLSTYNQVTDKRVYPDVDGRFEDPVIWKDHIQYHLIVNDWLGRIAWYLRSKDGINWVVDPGEAYKPGVSVHPDGRVEDWFKYERLKVYQDEYGRAIQANFAVIDTLKFQDKPYDNHSSKNIAIPLNPGLLLTVLNEKPITARTKTIRVKIESEDGFDAQKDVDVNSLRFGASTEVNFGRGAKAIKSVKDGDDLIVTFSGKGNGITAEEFAPKLIGTTTDGEMLYGYAKLPYVDYIEPILSARAPKFVKNGKGFDCQIVVDNYGQVGSKATKVKVEAVKDSKKQKLGVVSLPAIDKYGKSEVVLKNITSLKENEKYEFLITIYSGRKVYTKNTLYSTVKE